MEYFDRKHPRLKDYDYSQNGYYFITICTQNKECILGRVGTSGPNVPTVYLSAIGRIVRKYVEGFEGAYSCVYVDRYVIMPNHIHLILVLSDTNTGGGMGSCRPTVLMVVRGLKTMVSREVGHSIWQASFYEHIIRNQKSYEEISAYLSGNPGKWLETGGTEI